jgi:hypothetical protein
MVRIIILWFITSPPVSTLTPYKEHAKGNTTTELHVSIASAPVRPGCLRRLSVAQYDGNVVNVECVP